MKLKKNDLIIVTVGKDKGRSGKIEKVFPAKGKVVIPGLNLYKKHRKPQGEGRPGEILTIPRPFPAENVALICPKCKQPTRIGYRWEQNKKVRVCRKCDAGID